MAAAASSDASQQPLTITRCHQRFLLKTLAFSQQYSHMYFARLRELKEVVEQRLMSDAAVGPGQYRRVLALEPTSDDEDDGGGPPSGASPTSPPARGASRSAPGFARTVGSMTHLGGGSSRSGGSRTLADASVPVYCIGTLFKVMPRCLRFLQEYTKELVRIDAGAEDGDDDEAGEDALALDDADASGPLVPAGGGDSAAAATSLTSDGDILILEDESGRVELKLITSACGVHPGSLVTGVVVGVLGFLRSKGRFEVLRLVTPTSAAPRPWLPSKAAGAHKPNYLAIVCGLEVPQSGVSPMGLEMLLEFVCGSLGDDTMANAASCIRRLLIGGNLVEFSEELKLKHKIRLEPADHSRLKLSDAASSSNTTAKAMRQVDVLLERIASVVEVDVMPGETDCTNCFLPQQPIHPILLPQAARHASLRLVTNPYEFLVQVTDAHSTQPANTTASTGRPVVCDVDDESPGAASPALRCLVTSGQNIDDVCRQSSLSPIQSLVSTVEDWSCLCPTCPNSLPCYPFRDCDPFVIRDAQQAVAGGKNNQRPHLVVACNQPSFATTSRGGTRYVSVPSFAAKGPSGGTIVLIDCSTPDLAVSTISVGLPP